MRVLVLGASGFIGQHVASYLASSGHDVVPLKGAKSLDLCDASAVSAFFLVNGFFDCVVHSCAQGGRRTKEDDAGIFWNNVRMLDNVLQCSDSFKSIIHFSSGAGECARHTPYGLSKRANDALLREHDSAYNFRIFGCFGAGEADDRFITRGLNCLRTKEELVVHQDRFFDFVYVEDLCKLVAAVVDGRDDIPRQLDAVYRTKVRLTDIASIIGCAYRLGDASSMGTEYIGRGNDCLEVHLANLVGLEEGIRRMRHKE